MELANAFQGQQPVRIDDGFVVERNVRRPGRFCSHGDHDEVRRQFKRSMIPLNAQTMWIQKVG